MALAINNASPGLKAYIELRVREGGEFLCMALHAVFNLICDAVGIRHHSPIVFILSQSNHFAD